MIKKTIEYVDWDGKPQIGVFYFNISAAEMVELEMTHETGSFKQHLEGILKSDNKKQIFQTFKELLRDSVGRRDGDNFLKSEQISQNFMNSGAYDTFLLQLFGDTNLAVEFFNGVFPKNAQLEEQLRKAVVVDLPKENVPAFKPNPATVGPLGQALDEIKPARVITDDGRTFAQYSAAELAAMQPDELKAMIARTKASEAGKVLGE